jgi:hypothetical protein
MRLTKSNRRPGIKRSPRSFNIRQSKVVFVKMFKYRNKGNPVRIKMICIRFGTDLYFRSNTPERK